MTRKKSSHSRRKSKRASVGTPAERRDSTAVVIGSDKEISDEAVSKINAAHHAFVDLGRRAVEYAYECGHLLSEVRIELAELGRGFFKRWVEQHCEFTYRSATRYMRFARQVGNETVLSQLPPDAYARSLQPSTRRAPAHTVPRLPRPADASLGLPGPAERTIGDAVNRDLIRTIIEERAREVLNYSSPPYPMEGIEEGLWVRVHFLNGTDMAAFAKLIGLPATPWVTRNFFYPPLRFVHPPPDPLQFRDNDEYQQALKAWRDESRARWRRESGYPEEEPS